MAEAYAVDARLTFRSNAPEVLEQLLKGFQNLNREIKETQEMLDRFTGSSINSAVRGLKRMSEIRLGTGLLEDMEKLQGAAKGITETMRAATEAAKAAAEASRAAGRVGGGATRPPHAASGRPTHTDMADAAMGAQIYGGAGVSFFERAIGAAMEPEQYMTMFRANHGIGNAEIEEIRAAADAIVRGSPGTKVVEALKAINDAFTVTGDIHEAIKAAPKLAQMEIGLAAIPGEHAGDHAFAAAQAVELLGRYIDPKTHQVSMEAFTRNIQAQLQVALGTGGRVMPESYRAFAKQARLGGMLADDQFLFRDLPAMLIALGGNRAGTGDAATYRQFIQGRMTQDAFEQLKRAGLIDKGAHWSHGRVADMSKHLEGADQFTQNPVQWVRDVLMPELKRHGVDITDKKKLGEAIAQWASTATGLGFLSEMALNMPGINKEAAKVGNTTSDPTKLLEQYSPLYRLKEFEAAENEFMVMLGKLLMGPALDGLKGLTGALQGLTDWAKANPDTAKKIGEVAAGLTGLAAALGSIGFALLLISPAIKIAKWATFGTEAAGAAGGAAAAGESAAAGAAARSGGWLGRLLRGLWPLGLTGPAGGEDSDFSKRKNDEFLRTHPHLAPSAPNMTVRPEKQSWNIDPTERTNLAREIAAHIVAGLRAEAIPVDVTNASEVGSAAGKAASVGALTRLTSLVTRPPTGPTGGDIRAAQSYPSRLAFT